MNWEAELCGNEPGPMVETDEKSWCRCLRIALKLLEEHLLKDDAGTTQKTGAQAMIETEPSTPMNVDTWPSVPVPSKRRASPASPNRHKPKKAKIHQCGPKIPGSQQPSNPFSNHEKHKRKDKEKTIKSMAPSRSGSQVQVASPDASGSGPGPSSGRTRDAMSTLHEVTTLPKTLWEDVLTPQTMANWSIGERTSEISQWEVMGDQSWSDFQDRVPMRPW
ncbi:uncharacterized protein F5147DRAFT_773839 [Suillus discolor]|uniref:Uncharacterized protein n=1 Tax=Suillus discolor TaxID=1912936 RepID=A0A9P7F861_9AGAM|nr:uncharacterized protein F5147DRAFT_773839 [Suillus discolor]KAG2108255.1 hypothetical protein F5147DRAFT_773839 [Suillus discolor]